MAFIISVLGVVLIMEGIPYFAFPRKVKQWALLLQEIPEATLRIIGLISMAAGLLMLYMVSSF
jgi:uncharacterized protein YjeT (DUF2065 family)